MKKNAVKNVAIFLSVLLMVFNILPMGAALANQGDGKGNGGETKTFTLDASNLVAGTYKDSSGTLEVTLEATGEGKVSGWKTNLPVRVSVIAGGKTVKLEGGFSGILAPVDGMDITSITFSYNVNTENKNGKGDEKEPGKGQGNGNNPGNGDNNGGGQGDENKPGKGNDNGGGQDGKAKKNKYKVNLIKGCNPLAESTFFILKDNTRVNLTQGMNELDIELDDIAKVGVVLKGGKELEYNKDEVYVESPKNENGTKIFKIECKENAGAAVKLVVKNCVGTFDQAWLILDGKNPIEFTSLSNLMLVLDENPDDIVGIRLKAGDKTTDYMLTDAKVTKETVNGVIVIKIHCDEKPPVEKPEMTKVKVVLKGCIGLVDKAWLILSDDKEKEFASLGKLLLELEGNVALEGIKGVKLKVGDKETTYLLADANVTEEKVDGKIVITINCGAKPPVEKPELTKVKLVVKGCIGPFNKAWLVLSNGKEVEFTSLLSLLLTLEEGIKLENIVGVKLQNGDTSKMYLLSDANVTKETVNGTITIKINCEQVQPPVVPAINKIRLLIEGCIGPVEKAVLVLKSGTEVEVDSNTLELLLNLGISELEGFKLTVYGEVKMIKLADLAANLITLKDGTLTVKLDCNLAEGGSAFTQIKLDLSNCIGTITKAEVVLKNGTKIEVLNNMVDLKAALALGLIERVEVTVNGQVKTFMLSELSDASKTVLNGLLTLKLECPAAPPGDNGGGGGGTPPGDNSGGGGGTTPPGDNSGGGGGTTPPGDNSGGGGTTPPAPPVIVIPENPTPGGPIVESKELAWIKLLASGCVNIGTNGKILLNNGEAINFTLGEDGALVNVNLNLSDIKGIEVELNGTPTAFTMDKLMANKVDSILNVMMSCESLTPPPLPANPGNGGGTDPGTGGETDPGTVVDPEDPARGGESDENPPINIGDNETPGGNVGGFDGSLPQTGESSPMPYYFIGMLLAVAGFGMLRASKVRS
ncbi:LPXTG cell wall anchor domain-containing protein [Bacillus sp. FJAT-27245]|uniref:LPXTG cell wall anchor domain-containing protein n=1 Tax=Bacillus sp. FJAT-27245 TaxID=1684144 RepID=UPI0006A7D407|nr:LPXTG cell wall anchor domain-containing protein [Bacillus sp. FJAT-27245]